MRRLNSSFQPTIYFLFVLTLLEQIKHIITIIFMIDTYFPLLFFFLVKLLYRKFIIYFFHIAYIIYRELVFLITSEN